MQGKLQTPPQINACDLPGRLESQRASQARSGLRFHIMCHIRRVHAEEAEVEADI